MKKKTLKKVTVGKIFAMAASAVILLFTTACGNNEDSNAPAHLEIHDSYADVSQTEGNDNGTAVLSLEGIITNNSELKTVDYASLPYLTIDGEKIETTYEPIDDDADDKITPGKSVVYSVTYEFDPKAEHEWKFGYQDGTVVSGLGDYACIKAALRNYEDKPEVTWEDIKQMEKEQKEKFKEFEKSQK